MTEIMAMVLIGFSFILGAWFGIAIMAVMSVARDWIKCKECVTGRKSDW